MFRNLVLQMHRELITSGSGMGTEEPTNSEIPNPDSQLESNQNPTNQPVPPTNNDEYTKRLEAALAQNADVMSRMSAQLEQITSAPVRTPTPEPVKKTPEEIEAEYYKGPGAFTQRAIDEAMERQVKPLNEFVQNFRSTEAVNSLIEQVKLNPRFIPLWDAQVEDAVRKQLNSVAAPNLNLGLAQQAAVNAIGLKTLGAFGTAPTPVPTPNSDPVPTPANVRPSNPPAPNTRPPKKTIELDENSRRIARENRQTPEEYVFWRDMPADKVMTAKWDKTKNEGTY